MADVIEEFESAAVLDRAPLSRMSFGDGSASTLTFRRGRRIDLHFINVWDFTADLRLVHPYVLSKSAFDRSDFLEACRISARIEPEKVDPAKLYHFRLEFSEGWLDLAAEDFHFVIHRR